MVSTVAALGPICKCFDIKITEDVTVSDLMVNVLNRIERILHKSAETPLEDTDFYKKWDDFSKTIEIENALKNDSDMKGSDSNPNNDTNSISSDNDDQSNTNMSANDE